MTTRWSFLTERERLRLENYDRRIVWLMGRRSPVRKDERLEKLIGKIKTNMDDFILHLNEKYNGRK